MKVFPRFLLLCLSLLLLVSCVREQEPDSDPVDPASLARATVLSAVQTEGELPALCYTVCLTDSYKLPVEKMQISLSVGEETYTAVTAEDGTASFYPTLAAGEHAAVFSFAGNTYYRETSLTLRLSAHERYNRSGVYVRGRAFNKIDLEELCENRVGNIYLHQEVLSLVSTVGIENFIAQAAEYGIQVHLWLISLWDDGDFVVPINTADGSYAQTYFDTEREKVLRVAALKGLSGIHFDYIRFDGETTRADKFRAKVGGGGEHAVTEFVRQMTEAAESVNEDLLFSGAIMPQDADLIPKYGQDVDSLSSYLDFFVPMLFSGNYGEDTEWVAECMRLLVQNHPQADFRPALLTYLSDANQRNKRAADLEEEVEAVYTAGASGVTLFYYESGETTLVNVEPAA